MNAGRHRDSTTGWYVMKIRNRKVEIEY